MESNVNLTNLSGLENIHRIPGDLSVIDNDQLVSFRGLDHLRHVGEHVSINSNAGLLSLEGLGELEEIGNELFIKDNANLHSLEGLENLVRLGGDFIFDNNPRVGDLRGLTKLISIEGNTLIVNNQDLVDFRGLASIRSLGGLLQIFNNPELRSLSGLDSVNPNSINDLVILESLKLKNCSQKSICQYLSEPQNPNTIRDNAEGCNTKEDILALCQSSGINVQPGVRVETLFYPNPTHGPLQVRGEPLEDAFFTIHDIAGRCLDDGVIIENQFDLSHLPSGMYIINLSYLDFSDRERIIKIE